jgi:hypothetical protein
MNTRNFGIVRRGAAAAATTSILLILLIATTLSPANHTQGNNEAIWQDGELLPPLPADPVVRTAAIAQAAANASSRMATPDGGPFYPTVSTRVVTPRSVNMADVVRSGTGKTHQPYRRPPRYTPTTDEYRKPLAGVPGKQLQPISHIIEGAGPAGTPVGALSVPIPPAYQEFDGIGDTGTFPPDMDMAVGSSHAIQVVNSRFRIMDKCGGIVGESSFAGFLNDFNAMLFSPDVIYDPWNDRFVMVVAALNTSTSTAWTYVSVTATSDPTQGWWTYMIAGSSGWPDEPRVGIDPGTVYLSANRHDFSTWSFDHAEIVVLNSAQMYSGAPVTVNGFTTLNNPGDGSQAFSVRPARMHTWPGTYYLINTKPGAGNLFTLWTITGAPSSPVLNSYNMTVGLYEPPPDCVQPDSTLVDMGDCRLGNAVYMLDSLWTCQTFEADWGASGIQSGLVINKFVASTSTVVHDSPVGNPGEYFGFPGIDVDADGRVLLCYTTGGPSRYMAIDYGTFHDGNWGPFRRTLKGGEASYYHSGPQPWWWGGYYSVDRDPNDTYTFWMNGEYAPSSPPGTWATYIGITTLETPVALSVTPSDTTVVTVLNQVAAWPDRVEYVLDNTGSTVKPWTAETAADWLYVMDPSGELGPGETDTVTVLVDFYALAPGEHFGDVSFADCYSDGVTVRTIRAVVAPGGECAGGNTWLAPPESPAGSSGNNEERGVYVSAIKDFEVCSVGMLADLEVPQTITARIYEANGVTRGALVAEGTSQAVVPGTTVHVVPVSGLLEKCRDYDIAFEFSGPGYWTSWSEDSVTLPTDCGGVLRIRDGELWGNASNTLMPALHIQGVPVECEGYADLMPEGEAWNHVTIDPLDRGLFIVPRKTINLCAIRWEAEFPATPVELVAHVYEASGTTRGAEIATGAAVIWSPVMDMHAVPVSVVLEEGHQYNISITGMPVGCTWSMRWDTDFPLPYSAGDVTVYESEAQGNAANPAISHFALDYTPGAGGGSFDLRPPDKPIPPPYEVAGGHMRQGMYVTSLIGQNLFSLEWVGDVPPGTPIYARVYEATGVTRGALISEGVVASSEAGVRWHNIPVSAVIEAGTDYDFEIEAANTNSWRWWNDESGLPYEPHGVLRVRDAERDGNASNVGLIPMFMYACDRVATSVTDSNPDRVPAFHLGVPYPNPASASMEVQFGLDNEGPVTIAVYDVSGRRIETLISNEVRSAGPGRLTFDTGPVPSGVYFVKMTTRTKSVSRKITIVK